MIPAHEHGKTRCALYCRVSKEDGGHNGVSIDMQEARLRDYARAKGWTVAEAYIDRGKSGRTLDRPALVRLRHDARDNRVSTVLVFKLDRLVRSIRGLGELLEEFEKQSIALVSLSESIDATSAGGRLMLNILGSVAQWERETIAERTKAALAHKRDQGQAYGVVPFGFRRHGDRLVPDAEELRTVRAIYGMRGAGESLRAVAAYLNERGIETKTSAKRGWQAEQVRLIVNNTGLYKRWL